MLSLYFLFLFSSIHQDSLSGYLFVCLCLGLFVVLLLEVSSAKDPIFIASDSRGFSSCSDKPGHMSRSCDFLVQLQLFKHKI